MYKIFSTTLRNWLKDDPFTLSAATAYYAIFSIPGLIVLILGIASFVFDKKQVKDQIFNNIESIVGIGAAQSINDIIAQLHFENLGIGAMLIGLATLLFGATGLFVQLQRSFNYIWEVQVKKSASIFKFFKDRLISFSMVVVIGFLLLISLSVTALLNILSQWLVAHSSALLLGTLAGVDFVISLIVISVLFASMFKILPDAKVEWRYALYGGLVSTILFNIGEYALNIYFQWAQPASTFGAASSLILLMIWVFYSCMILLIGAEFTKTYAEIHKGEKAEATDIAKKKLSY